MPKTIHLCPPLITLLLALLLASTASAFNGHAFSASFGPEGPGSSTFKDVQGIAVDQTSGDVYVYDNGSGSIYKFNAAGEKTNYSGLGTNVITGVGAAKTDEEELAFDNSTGPDHGDLYVSNNSEVLIYDSSSGQPLGTLSGGEPCGVAVDSSGEVYVGYYPTLVKKYTPHTNPVTNADYTSSLYEVDEVCNVAASPEGDVYVNTWLGGVRKYAASQFNTSGTTAVSTPPETILDELGGTLAVDPSTNDVYVDEVSGVGQYAPSGALVAHFGEAGSDVTLALRGSHGIAVNGSTGSNASGDIYVSGGSGVGGNGAVDIYEPAALPTTHTDPPSNIAGTTVTLHGNVEDPDTVTGGVGYYFSYNVGTSCVGTGSIVSLFDNGEVNATGNGDVTEEVSVSGLEARSHYSACFLTRTYHGLVVGEAVQFTTLAASPSVENESASSTATRSTTLEAQINPEKRETTCMFQYVSKLEFDDSGYTASKTAPCEPAALSEGGEVSPVSASIAGLEPATLYHFRVIATNETGVTTGADHTLATLPLAPEAITGQASLALGAAETVTGTVDPRGGGIWNTEYQVQYGLTTTYGSQVQGQAGTGDSAMSVSSVIPELQPGVSYHYRVIAKNAGGESVGTDGTFTVGGVAPVVGSESALFVNEYSAMIQGELNPQGAATAYEIQYGPSTAYGSSSASIEIAPFTSSQGTLTEVVGLIPGTTYHYRLVAANLTGTTYGQDETFRTAGATPTTVFTSFAIPTVPQIAVAPFTLPGTGSDTKSTLKTLTPKQKLAAALKLCSKKPKSRRAACQKRVRKLYAPKRKNK